MNKIDQQFDDVDMSPAPEELSELPGLLGLFRKAVVKSDNFELGQPFPFLSNYVKGVQIEKKHLLAYQKLLGFEQNEQVPPTYLSMLGFPMILRLMTHTD